jgi:hypothetical protein
MAWQTLGSTLTRVLGRPGVSQCQARWTIEQLFRAMKSAAFACEGGGAGIRRRSRRSDARRSHWEPRPRRAGRSLDQGPGTSPVLQCRDSRRPLPAIRFWNVNTKARLCLVGAEVDAAFKLALSRLQAFSAGIPCHFVHASRRVPLQPMVCFGTTTSRRCDAVRW